MGSRSTVKERVAAPAEGAKHEVLNAFCIVRERHLDPILHVAQDWYSRRRGPTKRNQLPPIRDDGEPPVVDLAKHRIECYSEIPLDAELSADGQQGVDRRAA